MSAQQEQIHSQIDTFCDGVLRKRDDMIISINCSQCSKQYEILWELLAISERVELESQIRCF